MGGQTTSTRALEPPTTLKGFARQNCRLCTVSFDYRNPPSFSLVARSCTNNALLQPPSAPDSTMEEGRTNLVPRLQQDAYMHALAAAQPGHDWQNKANYHVLKHADQFVCLYTGCEISFATSELLEQHIGIHSISDISRLAPSNSAVDIACNDNPALATVSNTHALRFHSEADHVGASSYYSGLPYPVGELSAIDSYNTDSSAPYPGVATSAQGPAAVGLPNEHFAAPFNWSDPSRFVEDPVFSSQPYDFNNAALDLMEPVAAESSNQYTQAAHWQYPHQTDDTHHPFATNPGFLGNNTILTGSRIDTNEQPAAESPFPTPASNGTPVNVNTGPPLPPRPMCKECNKTFGRQSDLERHAKSHQANSKVSCPVAGCKYSSYRKDKLDEHVGRRH